MNDMVPDPVGTDLDGLLAQVHALRGNTAGSHATAAPRLDPVRLHYVEALARRLQAAPPAVQKVLQPKLAEALKGVASCVGAEAGEALCLPGPDDAPDASVEGLAPASTPVQATKPAPVSRKPRPKARPEATPSAPVLSLLGQLNQHIRTASSRSETDDHGAPLSLLSAGQQDLKSATRFRETWARISAEVAVDQAAHRAPENAGPLNAHNLVLRTLSLMRELSPDYLRRFMSHTESLLWLDRAYGQLKQPASKPRPSRSKK